MDTNYIARGTALDGRVRAFAVQATDVVAEIQRRHGMAPVASAAAGRTAMGALLLAASSLKKEDQLLTVEIGGGGPIGRILATATGAGGVRALVSNPLVHAESVNAGKLNVSGVVGREGYLSVTKDLGMREPYRGTVELQSGEIGDDFAYYLGRSEQAPSAVGLGVFVIPDGTVTAAGGFLVQLLPGLGDAEVAEVEREIAALPHPTTLIRDGVGPEAVLERIFGNRVEILDRQPVTFACPCSRERFEAGLVTLGPDELRRIIAEEENDLTEVVCHFCNEAYHFTAGDLERVLQAATTPA